MKLIKSKKGLALLAVLAIVAISAVGAYAYFTNSGNQAGTPVTVGTQAPDFAIAFNKVVDGTSGLPTSTGGATTYTNGNLALLPTIIGDANKDVATVPFTITNGSEAQELLTSYTVSIDASWSHCNDLSTPVAGLCGDSSVACTAADFAINPDVSHGAGDSPVTVSGASSPVASPTLPVELQPASDKPANTYASSFGVQLVDLSRSQDNCKSQVPAMHVSATS